MSAQQKYVKVPNCHECHCKWVGKLDYRRRMLGCSKNSLKEGFFAKNFVSICTGTCCTYMCQHCRSISGCLEILLRRDLSKAVNRVGNFVSTYVLYIHSNCQQEKYWQSIRKDPSDFWLKLYFDIFWVSLCLGLLISQKFVKSQNRPSLYTLKY